MASGSRVEPREPTWRGRAAALSPGPGGPRTSGGGARSRRSGAASREVSSFESLGGGAGASGARPEPDR